MSDRRRMLQTSLALGAMQVFPKMSFAQARRLVFATFTGSWEEAHRAVLVPAFRKATNNADITLEYGDNHGITCDDVIEDLRTIQGMLA